MSKHRMLESYNPLILKILVKKVKVVQKVKSVLYFDTFDRYSRTRINRLKGILGYRATLSS